VGTDLLIDPTGRTLLPITPVLRPRPWLILISPRRRAVPAAVPPDLAVVPGVGVDLGRTMLVPDLAVIPRSAVPGAALARPAGVLLAVEIVSPSSVSMDRLLKPARYAEAGIPSYWRVEGMTSGEPSIVIYDLDGNRYRETAVIHAGEQVEADRPFRVTLAPAQLVP
jgi:Uma2 family endonuclease